jgi:hypothetical protein
MNTKTLFSIYTNKGGHAVLGFDTIDGQGRTAIEQVKQYAETTYNDPADPPMIYVLKPLNPPQEPEAVAVTPPTAAGAN